jgi:hypothetical protein
MEHRLSPRIKGSLGENVSRVGLVGHYLTRDFCRQGMFLETGPVDLCRDELVRLYLTAHRASVSLRAVLAHHSSEGVGLLLVDYDPAYCHVICEAQNRSHGRSPSAPGKAPCMRSSAAYRARPAQTEGYELARARIRVTGASSSHAHGQRSGERAAAEK